MVICSLMMHVKYCTYCFMRILIVLVSDPYALLQSFLGVDKRGFGFTKTNELFVGRVAMLVSCSVASL